MLQGISEVSPKQYFGYLQCFQVIESKYEGPLPQLLRKLGFVMSTTSLRAIRKRAWLPQRSVDDQVSLLQKIIRIDAFRLISSQGGKAEIEVDHKLDQLVCIYQHDLWINVCYVFAGCR